MFVEEPLRSENFVPKNQASLILEMILPQKEGKDCRKGFGFKNYLLLTLLSQGITS